jgi:hypothetical protein
MREVSLHDLQVSVQDKQAFGTLGDYWKLAREFLGFLKRTRPTRIVSPSQTNYFFYQYSKSHGHRITRPLNSNLYIESLDSIKLAQERFMLFLADLRKYEQRITERRTYGSYLQSNEVSRVVYTLQQSIGCIGDSFGNPNQSRKRIGQLFENLIRLMIQEVGLDCEPRTINIPIPGFPGYEMSYELDLVFSRNKAIIASETKLIQAHEVVGSVKTTSKDRIDKERKGTTPLS